ncbi:hypothetical protein MNBD_CHLOROFLEXI01-4282 [hydrothermal vent metagenome]|uniref:DUF7779 domain-containing protein n=1 Tax=hydrothermal vent metagenome TaxID=652676 RepID=A0A3B0VYW1_9ZZZZ
MTQHNRLPELADYVRQVRPNARFNMPEVDDPAPLPTQQPAILHHIPHPRNRHFTGREAWLTQLEETLKEGQTAVITQTIAGLGGIGKTQLALEYCHRHLNSYSLIYWLAAENEVTLAESVSGLGIALGLPMAQLTNPQARLAAVKDALSSKPEPWLLIIDNADTLPPKVVAAVLPSTGQGHVLITSRSQHWDALAKVMRLDVFTPDEASHFLLERSGQTNEAEAAALAKTLGYFPLALEHAAAYVRQAQCPLREYEAQFKSQRQAILAGGEIPIAYHATITTTWELAFEQVHDTLGALDLLNLCSFLAPEAIPLDLIRGMNAKTSDFLQKADVWLPELLADPLKLNKAITALHRYSLLERSGDVLTMHRLVQMIARDRMGNDRAKLWAAAAIELIIAVLPDWRKLHSWQEGSEMLPQMTAVADNAANVGFTGERLAFLANWTGFYLQHRAEHQLAKPFYERALAIREKVLGADHPDTATSLNNMGFLLQAMGDLPAARPFYERALAIWEKVLGADHPDTANSLNNMGALLRAMGDLPAARPFYQRALAIREKVLGADHPDTATSLNNMGFLLQAMGDLPAARPFYERALAIREKVLGADHPDTVISLNNLSWLYHDLGNVSEAVNLMRRAVHIWEKTIPNH